MTNIYVSQVAVTRACDHRVITILVAVIYPDDNVPYEGMDLTEHSES